MAAPLSYKAFHKQTGGGVQAFQRYLNHWSNAAASGVTDAFNPTPNKAGFADANTRAAKVTQPLIAGQNQLYKSQTQGLSNAVTGFGQAMQQYLAPLGNQIKDTYATSGNALAGINSGVRDIATGEGQGLQSQLAHFAQLTDQPAAEQGVADAGARTQSAGQMLGAFGAAGLGENALKGEAARLYQLAQPSAFAAMGNETLGQGLSSLAVANNSNLSSLRGKQADLASSLYGTFLDRELQKAVAKATYDRSIYATDAGVAKAYATQAGKVATAKTAAKGKQATTWRVQSNGFTTKAQSLLARVSKKGPIYKMVPEVVFGQKTGVVKRVQTGTGRQPNYLETRKQLINLAAHYLTGYYNPQLGRKMTTGDARQAAIEYLFASGLYPPGKYGRPGVGTKKKPTYDFGQLVPPGLRVGGV